jgi:peptidoglycan/LPS O-acetylase OafA/YrhL
MWRSRARRRIIAGSDTIEAQGLFSAKKMTEQSSKSVHFFGLNALRFFAAFVLIAYHCSLNFQEGMHPKAQLFTHNLTLGVDFFFLISGFLIVYLLIVEKVNFSYIDLGKFYQRRILRIFPLYFLILAIGFFAYQHQGIPWNRFITFTGNFWIIENFNWTIAPLNPLWSLCIEEHFYAFIPIAIAIFRVRLLPYLFLALIAWSIYFRFDTFHHVQWPWYTFYCHTLSRFDLLAVGGFLACLYQNGTLKGKLPKWMMPASVVLLIVLFTQMDSADYGTIFKAVFKKYIIVAPMVVILLYVILNRNQPGMGRENRVLAYLGSISYGLYMFHSPVLDLVNRWPAARSNFGLNLVLVTIATIGVSALSYRILERPLLRLKEKLELVHT